MLAPAASGNVVLAALVIAVLSGFAPSRSHQDPELDPELGAAVAALSQGQLDVALEQLQRLEAARPASAEVALFLGHAYRLRGERVAALARYARGLELAPEHPRLLLAVAELQQEGGNFEQAAALYARAIDAAPDTLRPRRRAARLEADRGNHAIAVDHLEQVVDLDDAELDDHVMLGVQAFLAQQFDRAAVAFERALEIAPGDPRALYGLGSVQARRPETYEAAVAHLRQAIELGRDDDGDAHTLLGSTLFELGDVDAAIAALERAIELDPAAADPHYRLALAHSRRGERDTARRYQERFAELTSERDRLDALGKERTTLMNAVAAAVAADDAAAAVGAVDELLAVASDTETLLLAATVWSSVGSHDRAVTTARQVAESPTGDWRAWSTLGTVLLEAGQPGAAREALQRAVTENPANAFAQSALGDTLGRLGELRAAAAAYGLAVAVAPQEPRYHLKLANTYRELGERELESRYRASYRRLIFARRVPRQQH